MVDHKIEKNIAEFFAEAIGQNYLIVVLISSYTQAKYQTKNLPFGLGKTTLAFDLSYALNGGDLDQNPEDMHIWDKVFKTSVYNAYALGELLEPGKPRLVSAIWDDVQATAPASQSVPIAIRELANFLSTERPEVAIVFFTAPNINSISAPLRKLVNFEVIVSERGYYEVHKISYYKNFKRPLQDRMHFDYVCENSRDQPFPAFTPILQERYDLWRVAEKRKLYPSMMKKLKVYNALRLWESEGDTPVTLDTTIVKMGDSYYAKVPREHGEKHHREPIQLLIPPATSHT